ncbi:MAG TPA: phage holin family protein [Phycisphaerae bacterium]|nr:phage holin family protein [Phycisphaerae bacterium]HOJ73373.1 phage holin family protein [Phycisphaerae bacterium]HOM50982.1 phage holin family protein [Phycisphaerae bacterium]HPP25789.1 phage holin family protein [Phycisphaerae bacterium]HPU28033.1 phage holin family protein [Phycisphaerae bacterium]
MATDVEYVPPQTTTTPTNDRSLGALFKRLRDETATLFRQEMRLAKVETMEKARTYGRNSALLGVGGGLAFAGLLFILLGASHGVTALLLAAGVSPPNALWLGPLIVGVVVAIVGYLVLRKGLNTLKRESIVPEQTLRSLQENQEWVKHKFSQQRAGT